MANNLSFSVRLELLADKFKQQAESAKASLRGIQFQALAMAGALGAGVTSISSFISSLVSTAREAGRARVVLRNISTDTREYARSLKFLAELTDKYGTDLIGTTEAFAKFKAAATPAGIAMAEQERIFSNISKAMASFGISGGEAALTMMAITQMMSKGKISSEELRRQLGERMPVAMQAMANAAGVSMSQLDKLLKEGKLRSAEIIGKFSDELAKLSGDTSTDNLESSLGRLKNSFTSLADSLYVYDNFKALVEKVKDLLDYLRTHLSNLYIWAGGLLGARLWGKFSATWSQAGAVIKASQAQAIADEAAAKESAKRAKLEAQKALLEAQQQLQRAEAAVQAAGTITEKEKKRLEVAKYTGDVRFQKAVDNFSNAQTEKRTLLNEHQALLRGMQRSEEEAAQRVANAKLALQRANDEAAAKIIAKQEQIERAKDERVAAAKRALEAATAPKDVKAATSALNKADRYTSEEQKAIRDLQREQAAIVSKSQREYDRAIADQSRLQLANITKREREEARLAGKLEQNARALAATGDALNKANHNRRELLAEARAKNEEARIKRLAALQASADKAHYNIGGRATNLPSSSASVAGVLNTQRAINNAGNLSFRPASEIIAEQTKAASTTVSLWARATTTVKLAWASTLATIRGLMATIAPMAIIAGITAIVTALADWYRKQKEINGLQNEYLAKQREIKSTRSDEEVQISRLFSLYQSLDGKLEEQKTVQHQLEKSLGLQEGSLDRIAGKYDRIKNVVSKILKLKEIDRQIDFYSETAKMNKKPLQDLYGAYLKKGGKSLSADDMERVGKVLAKSFSLSVAQRNGYLKGFTYDKDVRTSTDNQRELGKLKGIYKELFGTDASKEAKSFIVSILEEGLTYQTFRDASASQLVANDAEIKTNELHVKRIKIEEEANGEVKSIGGSFAGGGGVSSSSDDDSKKSKKKSELQRTREAAAKELNELHNQRAAGIISEEEYRLALDKVATQYREKLASLLGEKALNDQQYQSLQTHLLVEREVIEEKARSAAELKLITAQVKYGLATEDDLRRAKAERAKAELNALIKKNGELDVDDKYVKAKMSEIDAVSAIADIQRNYADEAKKLEKAREEGRLKENEYAEALAKLISSTRERANQTATTTEGQEKLKKELGEKLTTDLSSIAKAATPVKGVRDTSYDYKKDEATKLGEEKQLMEDYVRQLQEAEKAGLDVAEALKQAQKETKTLDQAIKVATIQSDLKKYREAVKDQSFSGLKSVAQSARHLKSAFSELQKAFDPDAQASAWERFFAVFDSATQGIDTILSLVKMIEGLTQARQVAAAAEQALTAQQVAGRTLVTTTEATSTATELGLTTARIAATQAETSADTVGAAAKAAKAHAGIPFVGVALAAVAVGGLIALISSSAKKIPKFANGGIVPGGDGSGDRVLARVNPGELILNKAQQGRLANHLTSAASIRVEVEGKIRAKDILQLSSVAARHKTR
ncbi:tape measure protein [uncultured Porphyromonas sp.]|uniref:tape measure protein n=1 Tax=uncultured Porphyromonas sp. TaxID=159274 RepID=UPI002609F25F|nr:tape measure protein [uncultured Porphyromonas sp.]